MTGSRPVLTMTGISKSFPGVRALHNVDFRLFPGEVHALMGENGAGKSTLIKALTGVYGIDEGVITLAGEQVAAGQPVPKRIVTEETTFDQAAAQAALSSRQY